MADHALNFKTLSTEKYRLYRVLQSHAVLSETYRVRINTTGKINGAIIFPEQFVSVYGQSVVKVSVTRDTRSATVRVTVHDNVSLIGPDHEVVKTMEAIYKIEDEHAKRDLNKMFTLSAQSPSSNQLYSSQSMAFQIEDNSQVFWFTNKREAIKFASKNIIIP